MVRDFDLLMKFNRFSTKFDIRKVNLENCVLGVLVTPSPALDYYQTKLDFQIDNFDNYCGVII